MGLDEYRFVLQFTICLLTKQCFKNNKFILTFIACAKYSELIACWYLPVYFNFYILILQNESKDR